jgi:hypothetical protein
MKTKNENKIDKNFVEQLRAIRDKVSLEIKDMTLEQMKDYLKKKKTLYPTSAWQKSV